MNRSVLSRKTYRHRCSLLLCRRALAVIAAWNMYCERGPDVPSTPLSPELLRRLSLDEWSSWRVDTKSPISGLLRGHEANVQICTWASVRTIVQGNQVWLPTCELKATPSYCATTSLSFLTTKVAMRP